MTTFLTGSAPAGATPADRSATAAAAAAMGLFSIGLSFIIERLSRSEARVTEVAEPFNMSLNAVSKHIRVLEASGVVERHRKGRDHILSINTRSLDEVDGWIERTRRYWEVRLDGIGFDPHELLPQQRLH